MGPRHAPSTKLDHSPNLWWLVTELNHITGLSDQHSTVEFTSQNLVTNRCTNSLAGSTAQEFIFLHQAQGRRWQQHLWHAAVLQDHSTPRIRKCERHCHHVAQDVRYSTERSEPLSVGSYARLHLACCRLPSLQSRNPGH